MSGGQCVLCAPLILYLRIFLYFVFMISQECIVIHHRTFLWMVICVFSFLYFMICLFQRAQARLSPMDLLPWLMGWRAVWALLSTSHYVPDETWQSVEVNTFFM